MSTISASTTSTTAYKVTADTTGNLVLQTGSSPTTAVTIDTSQNMGLGVTPSAWSGFTALQIQNGALFTDSTSFRSIMNGYYNGSNWIYSTTNAATRYEQVNGIHRWFNAASGTAGNAITFTQAMTLDASGNLVLGDTAAPYSSKISRVDNSNSAVQSFFARNTNTGSSASCGYYLNAYGNSWSMTMGSSANNSNALVFSVDAVGTPVEKMRIDTSGNLLVGRTTSAGKFCVTADTNATAGNRVGLFSSSYTGGDSGFEALGLVKYANDNGAGQVFQRFFINNGNNGNGQIVGAGSGQATFSSYSDERLKENIVDLPPQLANIMALRPVEFDYKDGSGHQINFIAQEMREVYPDCVSEDSSEEKILSIAGWSKTEARLVKAIQEQQAIIETLTNRITALENK